MAEPVKMVIDCDVGTDDSQAILMALSQPHIQVVAITTVFGNAPLVNTSWNALRVLKVAGRLDVSGSKIIILLLYFCFSTYTDFCVHVSHKHAHINIRT